MPNDCYNGVFLYADKSTIDTLEKAGLKLCQLVSQPPKDLKEEEWKWRAENWGTDRFYLYNLRQAGVGAIDFSITTAWSPPLGLWLKLVQKFKDITFFKDEWSIEVGAAGVWIARREKDKPGKIFVQQMSWDEGCMEMKYHNLRKVEGQQGERP